MSDPIAEGWPLTTPEEAGFRADVVDRLDAAVEQGKLPNLHAVLVARDGQLVFEHYYEGVDEAWGAPLGHVEFGPDVLHDVRSVTKSIVGLLYGIALNEGAVPPLDALLLVQFPDYADLAGDSRRDAITVGNALSMQLGTEWNEDLPYSDPRNSEIEMEMSADRIRFVLSQPMVAEPGTRWRYNGGTTAVLGHLIARGTGQDLEAYARDRLFGPLGITKLHWTRGSNGAPSAASGLRLRARDLAKIGRLVLDDGRWNGAQIVPAEWLEQSFKPRARVDYDMQYGLHWWLYGTPDNIRWAGAFGNGGQRLMAIPVSSLVVVVFAGNYNKPDAWRIPVSVFVDYLLPALTR